MMSKKAAGHHKNASEHLTHAAHHQAEAAKHHEAGNHEKAAPTLTSQEATWFMREATPKTQ